MDILIKLSQFLLSLSLLIVLHELGHFIPARLFKTRVEKFYLFFDYKFSLFKKKIGDTVYGIGWIPLGGYVKISGMIDESMDTEQMQQEPQPWEFRSKPAWQRLIIMLGGVTVNFILAFVIYIGMTFYYGDSYIANDSLKSGVWVQSDVLKSAGMQTGDKIVSIDGEPLNRLNEAFSKIITAKKIEVLRNNETIALALPVNFVDQLLKENNKKLILPRVPVIITQVSDDSPNKDVLETKDFITSINNQPIEFVDQLPAVLEGLKGQKVTATLLRADKPQTVQLQVTDSASVGIAHARFRRCLR